MIAIPGGAAAALNSAHFTVKPSVSVIHPTLGQVDLSDRVTAFAINASMDNACIAGTVTFSRGSGTNSLSPLITTSTYYSDGRGVLDPNLNIYIGVIIDEYPEITMIRGRIDRVNVNAGAGLISVNWRDESAYYMNRTINEETAYGSDGGTPSQDVIAAIFDDWVGVGSSANINVYGVPDFSIITYSQTEMNVLEACRRIAQQHGWDFRWFISKGGMAYYNPREFAYNIHTGEWIPIPDVTLAADRYEDITELAWGDEDVRNQWDACFYDADAGGKYTIVYAEDATSIARYGPRYARINLDRTTNIDTMGEIDTYLALVLQDTSTPFASHKIRLPCYPAVELNDIHGYAANDDEYDTYQTMAVVAYDHQYSNGHMTTTIAGRGNPIVAYRDYRRTVDRHQIIQTVIPDATVIATEGTVCFVTDSLAFP